MLTFDRKHGEPAIDIDGSGAAAHVADLSAFIAHEVSHPLTAVLTSSNACQRWLTANPPNIERALLAIERITRAANTACDVVNHIRVLSRRPGEMRDPTALAGLVEDARDLMVDEASRYAVRMELEVEADLPRISVDRIQIRQVLINLIRNGLEAMEFVARKRVLRLSAERLKDTVQIAVSDRGNGLEFPDKIFDPFFTTKLQGMGMGLAICRTIVEAHGGHLFARENAPHGSTFVFALPFAPASRARKA
jgi:signal transduction histidine kinase